MSLEDLQARCLRRFGQIPVLADARSQAQQDFALTLLLRALLGGKVREPFAAAICRAESPIPAVALLNDFRSEWGTSAVGSCFASWEERVLAGFVPDLFRECVLQAPPTPSPYPPPPPPPETPIRTLNRGFAPKAKRGIALLGARPISQE